MKDEALKLALEALVFDGFTPEDLTHRSLHAKAITAIKQALAAPVQRIVANMTVEDGRISFAAKILADGTYDLYTTPPAQPALGDIRALKHRIHELEGDVLGYKQMLDLAEEKLKSAPVQEPVGEVKNLFTQAAWEKLDVRGSTKVYLGTPPAAQRKWANLPDEEIKILWVQYRAALPRYLCFAKALLRRSKEENT
jgi:hypothetical protein